jgi:hypothetical protein
MALPNDVSRVAEGVANYSRSSKDITDAKGAAKRLIRRTIVLRKPAADAMAADTTAYTAAEMVYAYAPFRILGAKILPQGALTAHATTNAVVSVVKGDGAGGAAVLVASYTSDTVTADNLVAGVVEDMPLVGTEAERRFAIGTVLGFNITKGSTGVVVPILGIAVEIEYEGVDAFGA